MKASRRSRIAAARSDVVKVTNTPFRRISAAAAAADAKWADGVGQHVDVDGDVHVYQVDVMVEVHVMSTKQAWGQVMATQQGIVRVHQHEQTITVQLEGQATRQHSPA